METPFIKLIFGQLVSNMKLIMYDKKKLLLFILITPLVYYIIRIQILIGFVFCIFYFISFILFYYLKTTWIMQCQELPFNQKRMVLYSLYNIFIGITKAKAFLIVYNFFYFFFNKEKFYSLSFTNFITFILLLFIVVIFKISIAFIIGFSYLSLLMSSELVIRYFLVSKFNFDSYFLKFEHILLNCFILCSPSVGNANESKIIFNDSLVTFNMKSILEKILIKFKNPELLTEAFSNNFNNRYIVLMINNHFSFIQIADTNENKILATNLTSSNKISVITSEQNITYCSLKSGFKPNLIGQNRTNYFTNLYTFDKETEKISPSSYKYANQINSSLNKVNSHFLNSKDDKLLLLKNGRFQETKDALLNKDFAEKYNLPIRSQMELIIKFESVNKFYLSTDEGGMNYELIKNILSENSYNMGSGEFETI